MMGMNSWQDKWTSINSKLETCVTECRTCIRSDQKCKDSIEAVMSDLWNLKDWLEKDPVTAIPRADMNAFIETPQAFNIKGCGALTTLDKHHSARNADRNNTTIKNEQRALAKDGYPIVFSATRDWGSGNIDQWEDAVELALRAAMEWEAFLIGRGLLTEATISRETPVPRRPRRARRTV